MGSIQFQADFGIIIKKDFITKLWGDIFFSRYSITSVISLADCLSWGIWQYYGGDAVDTLASPLACHQSISVSLGCIWHSECQWHVWWWDRSFSFDPCEGFALYNDTWKQTSDYKRRLHHHVIAFKWHCLSLTVKERFLLAIKENHYLTQEYVCPEEEGMKLNAGKCSDFFFNDKEFFWRGGGLLCGQILMGSCYQRL